MKKNISAIRASASLPLLSRMVPIDGQNYLDGGVADSIPPVSYTHLAASSPRASAG